MVKRWFLELVSKEVELLINSTLLLILKDTNGKPTMIKVFLDYGVNCQRKAKQSVFVVALKMLCA